MMDRVSVANIELQDLHEVDGAGRREEIWHDAVDAFPANTITQESESSTMQSDALEDIADDNVANAKAKISCTASTGIGTWVGVALGIGALVTAIYYGYWSLSLQRWSALKDFKSECQEAKISNISTPECVTALALPTVPPPVLKRFAQRLYDCVTFQPGCSEASEPNLSLDSRSISEHKKPWWLLLIQTLGLLTSVSVLHWLGSIPPNDLRAAIQRYFGGRALMFLRYLRVITWETCVFLSCFSPLYAVWFWWIYRKRIHFSSVVGLTYIGGAFTVYYVYGSRVAGSTGRKSAERSWRVDLQSVEQQVWTRPDGVRITRLDSDMSRAHEVSTAITSEFQSGPIRRHR